MFEMFFSRPDALRRHEEGPYDDKLNEFSKAQIEERGLAPPTVRNRRKEIRHFFDFVERQQWRLEEMTPERVDAYFAFLGQKWQPSSIKGAASSLRAWFRYCEVRQWTRPRLAQTIITPRLYRFSSIPLGPTWDEVRKLIGATGGDSPKQLRNRAILVLLALYGLRPGELLQLSLDDIDWQKGEIRIARLKAAKVDRFPIDPALGNALAQYLRQARPRCDSRALFLTMTLPRRRLSARRLCEILKAHCTAVDPTMKSWPPRSFRHACAQRLLETGHSFKEIGDHLGHRDPNSTAIYAKVDLKSLRLVAMDDLGGLA